MRLCARVVKGMDLKSIGRCPRWFKSSCARYDYKIFFLINLIFSFILMKYIIRILFTFFLIFEFSNAFILPSIPHLSEINPELAVSIVKKSTSILPQFDSVGHIVLSTNELLINKVLEIQINSELKKKIILFIIDLSRQGDEMGGKILENYYKLIDYIL